jgi:hypothetical protein
LVWGFSFFAISRVRSLHRADKDYNAMPREKLTWIEAIERVLDESDQPLHSMEIARVAIRRGWVKDKAAFPDHSVQAAVLRHIKEQGNPRGFLMVGFGRMQRRYWLKRKHKG